MLKYRHKIGRRRLMRELKIGSNDAGQRADKFLTKTLVGIPQSLLHKYFRKKCIKINGTHAKGTEMLSYGDILNLYISDEFFPDTGEKSKKHTVLHTLSENDIAYEDENIIILDKAQGEAVHSSLPDEESKDNEVCLVDRLIGYLIQKGEYIPEKENSFTPALCNRLDRNTSGLVIAAKNAESLRIMNEKIKNREMSKIYHTHVYGIPQKKEAVLKDFHYKNRSENRVYIFPSKSAAFKKLGKVNENDIKTVVTKYSVLEAYKDTSLLEVELITGRTHQIRAHLSYIGHPIVGDGKYGVNHSVKTGVKYQKLCSYSLTFRFESDSGILSYLDGKTFISRRDITI
jgi:23S rRNA pseudouridine955/2504/2580 synthase